MLRIKVIIKTEFIHVAYKVIYGDIFQMSSS